MKTLLIALNAKKIHKSLAVWQIKAFCDQNGIETEVIELDINMRFFDILDAIIKPNPTIIGFSCYIWNIELVTKLGIEIKKLFPNIKIVLGGPEVSFLENGDAFSFADKIISGDGENSFYKYLVGSNEEPPVSFCPSPYTQAYFESFSQEGVPIERRLVYFESSRGCPFSCSFCLSSATSKLSYLPLEEVFSRLTLLIERGAKTIKFTDRTANTNSERFIKILDFVCSLQTDCVFHFEAVAELFTLQQLEKIKKMPVGRVQFEIGVQSLDEKVLSMANRKQNRAKTIRVIKRLISFGTAHIHISLIAGLEKQTKEGVLNDLDEILATKPHKVQLGFLKLLKGSELSKKKNSLVFADFPPYEILKTDTLSGLDFSFLRKVEFIIDKFFSSGAYKETVSFAIKRVFSKPTEFIRKILEYEKLTENFSLNAGYSLLLDFLTPFTKNINELYHYIKLDCFSFDRNGLSLPKQIKKVSSETFLLAPYSQATNDNSWGVKREKREAQKNAYSVCEYFPFDNKTRLFIYDKKCPVTNRYSFTTLPQ